MRILLIIISCVIFIGCTSSVQENTFDVPENVKNSFAKKYPGVKVQKWEMDKNDYYEARFQLNNISYRADFAEDGSWIETENSMSFEALPKEVKAVIQKDYNGHEIVEIEQVDNFEKGTFFDIEFKKRGKKQDVMIRSNGEKVK